MMNTASHNDRDQRDHAEDIERLMTRIIDREADDADRQRFAQLATDDPSLWRALAERRQDMLDLSQEVASELAAAFQVNVDLAREHRTAAAASSDRARRPRWWLGWAAAAAIATGWFIHAIFNTAPNDPAAPPIVPVAGANDRLNPHQHLRHYLRSPFVIGELDPIMLKYEEMGNNQAELRILRRIEEAYLLDADDPPPVDSEGRLIRDPVELEQLSIGPAQSN